MLSWIVSLSELHVPGSSFRGACTWRIFHDTVLSARPFSGWGGHAVRINCTG